LPRDLQVACEQHSGLPVTQPQDDGVVVEAVAGPSNGHGRRVKHFQHRFAVEHDRLSRLHDPARQLPFPDDG